MNANGKYKIQGRRRGWSAPGAGRRGFTAIELSAVASIIAILALILVPIVRGRLLEAQIAAALDDMHSIEVAQVSAFADTNFFFRLSDLDNSISLEDFSGGMNPFALQQVPAGSWNRPFIGAQLPDFSGTPGASPGTIASNWKGPYINYHNLKYIPLHQLLATDPGIFTREYNLGGGGNTDLGPIVVFSGSNSGDPGFDAFHNENVDPAVGPPGTAEHAYPIDPWGNPYFFFGTGRWTDFYGPHGDVGRLPTDPSPNGQFSFGNCMVYSLGPDGLVGGNPMNPPDLPSTVNLFRERNPGTRFIGESGSDDLVRFF